MAHGPRKSRSGLVERRSCCCAQRRRRVGGDGYRYCRISLRGGAICRLIRVIRWFDDFALIWLLPYGRSARGTPDRQGTQRVPSRQSARYESVIYSLRGTSTWLLEFPRTF